MGREEDLQGILSRLETPTDSTAKIPTTIATMAEISSGDLRKVASSNPGHPISPIFGKAVETFPDEKKVVVERLDLMGILENREVIRNRNVDEKGQVTFEKELGRKLPGQAPVDSLSRAPKPSAEPATEEPPEPSAPEDTVSTRRKALNRSPEERTEKDKKKTPKKT